ncbi:membrane protein insertion efficiency factor YidD [Candidatus Gracilibacteria bacterium]|nr:membrane protein insertion efficiency factor YidD [Candidatus Gracilibacteria bacterium]
MKKILLFPDTLLAQIIIGLIKIYQRTISPDHSEIGRGDTLRTCKFYPTCSEYAVQTLKKQGFIWGFWKILWRLLRCNPWNKGGVDMPK